jgi:hypothetical protein
LCVKLPLHKNICGVLDIFWLWKCVKTARFTLMCFVCSFVRVWECDWRLMCWERVKSLSTQTTKSNST